MNLFQTPSSADVSPQNSPASTRPGPLPIAVGLILLILAVAIGLHYKVPSSSAPTQLAPASISPFPSPENEILPTVSPLVSSLPPLLIPPVPTTWKKTFLPNHSLTLCLPPKWELDQWGGIFFNRDAGYQPNITYLQDVAYTSGSYPEAYLRYWQSEYPEVSSLVTFQTATLDGHTVLTVFPADPSDPKSAPDGSLAVIWPANHKLWKAGLSTWNMINTSQSDFLRDFYTAISCSFTTP